MTASLPHWATDLLSSLELAPIDIDVNSLQRLVHLLDDAPQRDAVLIGFIAGYAAGMAEGEGMASFDRAHAASLRFMSKTLSGE